MSKWLARARSENLYRSGVPKLPKLPKSGERSNFVDFGTFGTALLQSKDGVASGLAQPEPAAPPEPASLSVPATYQAAFENLCAACPSGVPFERWRRAVDDAERFLSEWGDQADRLGWTAEDLFGLHPTVPLSRVDCMGLAWLLKGQRVVSLTATEARMERGLAYYRKFAPPSNRFSEAGGGC